jgi:hypothetical protein
MTEVVVPLALLAVIGGLLYLRRIGRRKVRKFTAQKSAERRTARSLDWLGTALILTAPADQAGDVVGIVARKQMARQTAPGHWDLVTGLDSYAASVALSEVPGGMRLAPTLAPDAQGTPQGAPWLSFRDAVAKAAAKAGVETRDDEEVSFQPVAGSDGRRIWVPAERV